MKDLETLFNVLLEAIEERLIAKSDLGLIRDQSLSYAGTLSGWRAELTFTDRAAYGGRTPCSYYSVSLWYDYAPAVFPSGSTCGFAVTSGRLWELVSNVATEMLAAEPTGQKDGSSIVPRITPSPSPFVSWVGRSQNKG